MFARCTHTRVESRLVADTDLPQPESVVAMFYTLTAHRWATLGNHSRYRTDHSQLGVLATGGFRDTTLEYSSRTYLSEIDASQEHE